MASRSVVLSPHPDDAVPSCWHLLAGGDTTVVTVFAGVPEPGTCGWWDRLTGASDPAARVRERLAEDTRAPALAGASSVRLDLLDEQYVVTATFPRWRRQLPNTRATPTRSTRRWASC
jgi:hypothetical protein